MLHTKNLRKINICNLLTFQAPILLQLPTIDSVEQPEGGEIYVYIIDKFKIRKVFPAAEFQQICDCEFILHIYLTGNPSPPAVP